jgi:hypothetical protein
LVIRKRHWILTLIEIVIPVVLFIVVTLMKSSQSDGQLLPAQYGAIWTEKSLSNSDSSLLYAPFNNFTKRIMAAVSSQLNEFGK